jgi:hypothetical protein
LIREKIPFTNGNSVGIIKRFGGLHLKAAREIEVNEGPSIHSQALPEVQDCSALGQSVCNLPEPEA